MEEKSYSPPIRIPSPVPDASMCGVDVITLEEFTNDEDIVYIYIPWITDDNKWKCYRRYDLWQVAMDGVMYKWEGAYDDVGHGGRPNHQVPYFPMPDGMFYYTDDSLNQLRAMRTHLYAEMIDPAERMGNREGSFGVSEMHGNVPKPVVRLVAAEFEMGPPDDIDHKFDCNRQMIPLGDTPIYVVAQGNTYCFGYYQLLLQPVLDVMTSYNKVREVVPLPGLGLAVDVFSYMLINYTHSFYLKTTGQTFLNEATNHQDPIYSFIPTSHKIKQTIYNAVLPKRLEAVNIDVHIINGWYEAINSVVKSYGLKFVVTDPDYDENMVKLQLLPLGAHIRVSDYQDVLSTIRYVCSFFIQATTEFLQLDEVDARDYVEVSTYVEYDYNTMGIIPLSDLFWFLVKSARFKPYFNTLNTNITEWVSLH